MLCVSVVLDDTGHSKGFGFIRFSNETEQQTALTSMMGVSGLGGKPLKVRVVFSCESNSRNSRPWPLRQLIKIKLQNFIHDVISAKLSITKYLFYA